MKHSLAQSQHLSYQRGNPLACYAAWRQALNADEALLLVDFELPRWWESGAGQLALTAIYCVRNNALHIAVTDRTLTADNSPPFEQFLVWVALHGLFGFNPDTPLPLRPEQIDKPWGREIWYTGVEARGICSFGSDGGRTPIPWLQAAVPGGVAGAPGEPLVLLKILDPLPQPVLGDLYFELHENKREVYVVTHVDEAAWPDGVGYLRYGFDRAKLAQHDSEASFRAAYLAAVKAYEVERRALDRLQGEGMAPAPGQLARERSLRAQMDGFTHLQPVRVGDVIQVPLLLPHSLQHGVRTVEFQTPTYERKILSFAQQVRTQGHWDTSAAVEQMLLTPPPPALLPKLTCANGVEVEQVVDFPDFEVRRVKIEAGASWEYRAEASYGLVMVVAGALELAGSRYLPEQAQLLPRGWRGRLTAAEAAQSLVLLLATPRS